MAKKNKRLWIMAVIVMIMIVSNQNKPKEAKKEFTLIELLANPIFPSFQQCRNLGGEVAFNWKVSEYSCNVKEDCVSSTCCHPSNSVNLENAPDCGGQICNQECFPNTIDCDNGIISCINNKCSTWYSELDGICTKDGVQCSLTGLLNSDCTFLTYNMEGGKWHLISFPLDISGKTAGEIFSTVPGKVVMTDDYNPLNDNNYINSDKAYWVYSTVTSSFTISGVPLTDLSVGALQGGINLVPYKSLQSNDILIINNIVAGDFDEVIGVPGLIIEGDKETPTNGLVYTPTGGVMSVIKKTGGTLTTLEPQHGYIIKTSSIYDYNYFIERKNDFLGGITFGTFIGYANNWVT